MCSHHSEDKCTLHCIFSGVIPLYNLIGKILKILIILLAELPVTPNGRATYHQKRGLHFSLCVISLLLDSYYFPNFFFFFAFTLSNAIHACKTQTHLQLYMYELCLPAWQNEMHWLHIHFIQTDSFYLLSKVIIFNFHQTMMSADILLQNWKYHTPFHFNNYDTFTLFTEHPFKSTSKSKTLLQPLTCPESLTDHSYHTSSYSRTAVRVPLYFISRVTILLSPCTDRSNSNY